MLLLCLVLIFHPIIAQDNYDFDDYNYPDECDYYNTVEDDHGCHHKKFPQDTLQNIFGQNVQTCCDFHGYIHKFKEECHVCTFQFCISCLVTILAKSGTQILSTMISIGFWSNSNQSADR